MSFAPVLLAVAVSVNLAVVPPASHHRSQAHSQIGGQGAPYGHARLQVAIPPTGCLWTKPVDAPVVDGFRPPAGPYGSGNRGLEYGVEAGATVVVVADGRVTFAGPVGGRRYLVVTHLSGLRSTYGPLEQIDVVRGQIVHVGQFVAAASAGFHLTARAGDRYIDPQPLIDGTCGTARLVAVDPAGATARPTARRLSPPLPVR